MTMEATRTPEEIRGDLDPINVQLLHLLADRDVLIDEMSASKQERGMAALQPERYQQMRSDLQDQGETLGLDREYVGALFDVIHEHSVARQEWRLA